MSLDKFQTIEYYLRCLDCKYSEIKKTRRDIIIVYINHFTFSIPCINMEIYWSMGNHSRKIKDKEILNWIEYEGSNFKGLGIDI